MTMRQQEGAVLHNVHLHDHPRLLSRGGEAGAATAVGSERTGSPEPAAAPPLEPKEDPCAEAFRKGREKGLQDALEEARRQARTEGRQRGLEEGRETAIEEVRRETEAARQALQARTDQLDGWLAAFPGELQRQLAARLAASEEDMIVLAHEVVCRLLSEHALERPTVAAAVRQAIAHCCDIDAGGSAGGLLAVRVHASDLQSLESDADLAQWLLRQGAQGVRWVADPRVSLGGCIVESRHGSLDTRLETQLASLQAALLHARSRHDGVSRARNA